VEFEVVIEETDLQVQVSEEGDAGEARPAVEAAVREARTALEDEIALRPGFGTSLEPLKNPRGVKGMVRGMYEVGRKAGVGPMAAVAGAVAEYVGRRLAEQFRDVIVENGGDVFLKSEAPRTVAVYAGQSPLSEKIGVVIPPTQGLGICTSSGTVGHSHSEGKADAALVICEDVSLADAAATALGNRVRCAADIEHAMKWASELDGVLQALVVLDAHMGVWGQFEVRKVGDRA